MSDTILVALIGAFATVLTALFQIFVSSRQSASGGRSTRNRIKGLAWTGVLLVAAAGGGFAYSEYLVLTQDAPAQALRDRIGQTLVVTHAVGSAVAAPSTPRPTVTALASVPASVEPREDSVASVTLPACKTAAAGDAACSEPAALAVTLCTPLPPSARVTEVLLYARPENDTGAWHAHRAAPGQDIGGGRFLDTHFERSEAGLPREVCQKFAHWNAESGRTIRVVIRYELIPASAPTAQETPVTSPSLRPAG